MTTKTKDIVERLAGYDGIADIDAQVAADFITARWEIVALRAVLSAARRKGCWGKNDTSGCVLCKAIYDYEQATGAYKPCASEQTGADR